MMRGVGSEIVLVDQKRDLAVAQAHDILDAAPWAFAVWVRAGEAAALDGVDIVVLAAPRTSARAGWIFVAQRCNLRRDRAGSAGGGAGHHLPDGVKSVDVMTQIVSVIAARHAIPSDRAGTILDSAQFRTLLAAHLGISPAYIDARVLGEHGDSEVLPYLAPSPATCRWRKPPPRWGEN